MAAGAQTARIAFIPKNLGNPFFDAVYSGIEEAAGELGFETVYIGPPTADPAVADSLYPTASGATGRCDHHLGQRRQHGRAGAASRHAAGYHRRLPSMPTLQSTPGRLISSPSISALSARSR